MLRYCPLPLPSSSGDSEQLTLSTRPSLSVQLRVATALWYTYWSLRRL